MLDEYERVKLYDKAYRLWGKDAQILMAVEEMSELTQILLHHIRKNKKVTYTELASEIADVRIMMEQLIEIFSIYDKVIEQEEIKLCKLSKYIESDPSDSASQVSKTDDYNKGYEVNQK